MGCNKHADSSTSHVICQEMEYTHWPHWLIRFPICVMMMSQYLCYQIRGDKHPCPSMFHPFPSYFGVRTRRTSEIRRVFEYFWPLPYTSIHTNPIPPKLKNTARNEPIEWIHGLPPGFGGHPSRGKPLAPEGPSVDELSSSKFNTSIGLGRLVKPLSGQIIIIH